MWRYSRLHYKVFLDFLQYRPNNWTAKHAKFVRKPLNLCVLCALCGKNLVMYGRWFLDKNLSATTLTPHPERSILFSVGDDVIKPKYKFHLKSLFSNIPDAKQASTTCGSKWIPACDLNTPANLILDIPFYCLDNKTILIAIWEIIWTIWLTLPSS